MVSVKFKCGSCGKEYHIDELGLSKKINSYYCPDKTCDYTLFEIKIKEAK